QRIERADQPPVGRQVDVDDLAPRILGDVMQRRERAQDAGIADENVELAPALKQRRTELIDLVAFAQVELQQRCLATEIADLVIEFLERSDGAGADDDMSAVPGEGEGDRTTDAA